MRRTLKGSPVGGVESEGSTPNVESDKKIVALQVKLKIMKQTVVSSSRINLECMEKRLTSLLDSGGMVSLVQQSYFNQNIKPKQGPARGPQATSHNLFVLKGANEGNIPIMRYFKMDVAFLGLRVPKVGFLVVIC